MNELCASTIHFSAILLIYISCNQPIEMNKQWAWQAAE